ncbi:50S ribosomal protein L29 [Acetilactobacillus jinshanensis]|uniref:Large ribosomal subunit protein uL29 n=1 Tax=Acetilactobacillus jinshanensis TaxID=1720083 RepID=A0A4P6ZJC0_9LACO|nr:50S ribosomal protein L29 [Acetilactobacillus jinshanensis]QBP17831.1 50S ribosomal protein L29 [Acetilactobacillus jinshanensis]URL60693.1 50S ribosomal protein L29 [uncultured bacterium]
MKAKDIKNLTTSQMKSKEASFKKDLFNLRFQLATGQLQNTAKLKQVRHNIARIKTVLRQKQLESAK